MLLHIQDALSIGQGLDSSGEHCIKGARQREWHFISLWEDTPFFLNFQPGDPRKESEGLQAR